MTAVRRLGAGVAIGAICLLSAACANTVGGTARPVDIDILPRAVSPSSTLDGILLSEEEINTIMGAATIELADSSRAMQTNAEDISNPDCLGALYNAEESVYRDSGWTDVRDEVLQEPEGDNAHWVEQTVVKFPNNESALAFLNSSLSRWSRCPGKEVTFSADGDQHQWKIGDLIITNGAINLTSMLEDGGGWGCQHAITVASGVILEATACAIHIGDQAVDIARKMSANVP